MRFRSLCLFVSLLNIFWRCHSDNHIPTVFLAKIGCDFSGFFNEIMGLLQGLRFPNVFLSVGTCTEEFLNKLAPDEAEVIRATQRNYIERPPSWKHSVVIQHKLPGEKFTPEFSLASDKRPLLAIGRIMTESAYISSSEIEYAKTVDEIWLPTAFHSTVLQQHGLPASKIAIIPEAVNIKLFAKPDSCASSTCTKVDTVPLFRFVSVFKWESRKGWDTLLRAYWNTFHKETHHVELVIRSYKPSWERGPSNLNDSIQSFALSIMQQPLSTLPPIRWISEELTRTQLRDLYHSAHAFVLPTRGEGWCLPCVEAMASGLPVIVSNFSGPTAYLRNAWSYPLRVAASLHTDGTAEPDINHLIDLMRHVVNHRDEAMRKGRLAAAHVSKTYSPSAVGQLVMDRIVARLHLLGLGGAAVMNTSGLSYNESLVVGENHEVLASDE